MISAVIQEDSYEVSLRINFISASPEASRVWTSLDLRMFFSICDRTFVCVHVCFFSRHLPDSRVDPMRLRIRTSVLWQRGETQPARVQTRIYTDALIRCVYIFDQPVHLSCVQWMTVAQQDPQPRERSRRRSGARTLLKSSRSVSRTHWHAYKNKTCIVVLMSFQESKGSLLLKELGPEGRGQISMVQQLLDEVRDGLNSASSHGIITIEMTSQ